MRPYALAATVAHEVRTPLATIRLQAAEIARAWPDLLHGYRLAVDHGLCAPPAHPAMLERLPGLAGAIAAEVASAHSVIDMALASVTLERLDRRTFAPTRCMPAWTWPSPAIRSSTASASTCGCRRSAPTGASSAPIRC